MSQPVIPTTRIQGTWAAVAVAAGLLIGGGITYRTFASRWNHPTSAVPIPLGTLGQLPLRLGDWEGKPLPLKEAIIEVTDTDDHLSRQYHDINSGGTVAMFVGYGVRLRDLIPHRPQVCYPGAGWTAKSWRIENIELPAGAGLSCQLHQFGRGELVSESVTVLNYYLVDGEWWADVSEIRSRAALLSRNWRYIAQIQISTAGGPSAGDAEDRVKRFAAASAEPIRKLLIAAADAAQQTPIGAKGHETR